MQEWFATKPEFEVVDSKGSLYLPFKGWLFSPTVEIGNYFMAIRRTK
jgi:polyprenyldihydroxybenzoate methyltransferase/3-demethylubiquinol 3-O-methyltransferase